MPSAAAERHSYVLLKRSKTNEFLALVDSVSAEAANPRHAPSAAKDHVNRLPAQRIVVDNKNGVPG
jgi:hypothetical protein